MVKTADRIDVDISKTVGIPYDRDVVKADKNGELLLDAYPESVALSKLTEAMGLIQQSIGC